MCIRLLLSVTIAVVLFCSVQDMGYHHHYLLLPVLLIFSAVFCIFLIQRFQVNNLPLLSVPLLGVILLNFSFGHVPSLNKAAAFSQPVTTAMRTYPLTNPHYSNIRRLAEELNQKLSGSSKLVYVVGDDNGLSPEILKRSRLPESVDAAPFVLVNNIVDLRDGFPSQFFLADYVLLSDPFRSNFTPPQQVSYQIYDMLLNDPALKDYYQLDATYPGSDGNILLYRKIKPADKTSVDILNRRLQAFYPENAFVIEPNYFIALYEATNKVRYSFNIWERAFELNKDAGSSLNVYLNDTRAFTSLSFALSCWTPGLEMVVRNQKGELFRGPVEVREKVQHTIDVTGSDSLAISITEAKPGGRISAFMILYAQELK